MLNVSWYDPDVYLTSTGDLKITQRGSTSPEVEPPWIITKGSDSSTITRIGAFAEVAVANIRAGIIETQKLIVDGVDILKKLTELSDQVTAQQREIDTLKTRLEKLEAIVNAR